jgi:hypothetical protein
MDQDDPDRFVDKDELSMIEFQSPGRFKVDNPPTLPTNPEEWGAAPFVLGTSAPAQAFSNMGEARQHALALIQQVRRSVSIYTPDLEPWLYNHSCIQKACAQFLLAHPRNQLRILIGDSSHSVRHGHRLVSLARRLTSNFHIRKLQPDYALQTGAFLLLDECGMLNRPNADQFSGHALYRDPGRVRQQQRLFDTAWNHSQPDPDLRSFLL